MVHVASVDSLVDVLVVVSLVLLLHLSRDLLEVNHCGLLLEHFLALRIGIFGCLRLVVVAVHGRVLRRKYVRVRAYVLQVHQILAVLRVQVAIRKAQILLALTVVHIDVVLPLVRILGEEVLLDHLDSLTWIEYSDFALLRRVGKPRMCKYFVDRGTHLSFSLEHLLEQVDALRAHALFVVDLVELFTGSQFTAPALSDLGLNFLNSDASVGQDTVNERVEKDASRPDIRLLAVPVLPDLCKFPLSFFFLLKLA